MLGVRLLLPAPRYSTTITTTTPETLSEQNSLAALEGPFMNLEIWKDHLQGLSFKKKGGRSKDMIAHQHFCSFFLFQLKY